MEIDINYFYKNLPILIEDDPIFISIFYGYKLAAPMSFWTFLEHDISAVVNGCGPGMEGLLMSPIF